MFPTPGSRHFDTIRSIVRHPKHHIFEFDLNTLKTWCSERGMLPFRAAQILEWVYAKGTAEPEKMTNLSKRDRETLTREMTFLSGDVVSHQQASDGVQKLLIQWWDGDPPAASSTDRAIPLTILNSTDPAVPVSDSSRQTECVMIPSEDPTGGRRTACISSQVGCPVGCRFCASGLGGLDGNLSTGRIIEQVWRLSWLLAQQGDSVGRISNVVFMGMGEPLANFSSVMGAVRILATLPEKGAGMGISARKITISTVGLPKAIERLAAELDLPVTLALSLHAPNDELRRQLIPWAEYTTIPDLLAACQKWFKKTGREITLEYILLRGVNDQPEHAYQLAAVAKTLRANVNLIRFNEVKGIEFTRPHDASVREFQQILRDRQINSHIRASRGRDIAAACGQLRHEASKSA